MNEATQEKLEPLEWNVVNFVYLTMKNIDQATSFDWDEFNEPESSVSKEESSLIDAFPELFYDNDKIEISFERTRNLIQSAESDTDIDFFANTELFLADISPKLAEELLKLNMKNNREPADSFVANYAKLMKEGKWGISAPLIFSSTGYLIDGQHRLRAVIKSQTCQQFIVLVGLPDEVSTNIDRGRKRNTVDVSRMSGLTWVKPKHTSTAIFMQGELNAEGLFHPKKVATEDLILFLEQYRNGIEFALTHIGDYGPWSMGCILAVIAKAYYSQPNKRDRLKEFCICLKTNKAIQGNLDNAALLFYKKLNDLKSDRDDKGGRVWSIKSQTVIIQYCQNALVHFLNERDIGRLSATKKDIFPLVKIAKE